MSKVINYSKWDHIEISDDEDDTHPNIDTASLFRWRHQARIEKMEKAEKDKKQFEEELMKLELEKQHVEERLKDADNVPTEEMEELQLKKHELEDQEKKFREKEEMLKKEEKLRPWNVDTLCKEKESKTLINPTKPLTEEEISEEDKGIRQEQFNKKYRKELRHFGMLKKSEDSKEFLRENSNLVCEETANYLVMWCIDLELEGKETLMEHVAYQTIVMQFILELSKHMKKDPRDCVQAFFNRMSSCESLADRQQYMTSFNEELDAFKNRVRALAKKRLDEAKRQIEEEERQKRLGPGGLDPVEVFEQLPKDLQECFETKDIQKLTETIKKMDPKEAEHYMKMCVDSGLWVPDANKDAEPADDVYEKIEEKISVEESNK